MSKYYSVNDIYQAYCQKYNGLNEYILNVNDQTIRELKWTLKGEALLAEYEKWISGEAADYIDFLKETY